MNKLESFFIKTYITHPKRTLLRFSFVFMVLGIVLSVAILSAGLNLFEGYERSLKSVLLDSFAHINVQSQLNEYIDGDRVPSLVEKLEAQDEVESVFATISYSAMVQSQSSVRGAMIRAYNPHESAEPPYLKYLEPGHLPLERSNVYIGYYMAKELGKAVGDSIQVIYPQLDRISMLGLMPSSHTFWVAGIYRSGYYEYDRSVLIMTVEDSRAVIMADDGFSRLEIRLKPAFINRADQLSNQYSELIGPRYYTIPWTVNNQSLLRLINMEKWLIFIIFSFLVLIAGLNVVSAVVTIIYDKKNEIAVLKTVGASQATIKRLVFWRIALVGFASVILGQIAGFLLSLGIVHQNIYQLKGDVYFIDTLSIHVSPFNQLIILIVSAGLIALCISLPLKRIDKMQIIDLIRNP